MISRGLGAGAIALSIFAFTACTRTPPKAAVGTVPEGVEIIRPFGPCRHSNAAIDQWKCGDIEVNHWAVASLAREAPLRVLTTFKDGSARSIYDPRSGFSGTIDYDAMSVINKDGEHGWRFIPIRADNGDWAVLVSKLEGEFETYRGLRRL